MYPMAGVQMETQGPSELRGQPGKDGMGDHNWTSHHKRANVHVSTKQGHMTHKTGLYLLVTNGNHVCASMEGISQQNNVLQSS